MAKILQFRRRSTAALASQIGNVGEIFIDLTKKTVVVMDGATSGGANTLATETFVSSAVSSYTLATTFDNLSSTVNTTNTNLSSLSSALVTANANIATLSSNLSNFVINTATTSLFGIVKPDGTSVLVTSGLISVNYEPVSSNLATVSSNLATVSSTLSSVISRVNFSSWVIVQSSNAIYFIVGGVNVAKLDSSGNLSVSGNVTAYSTIV